ncbi:MAG: CbiX/SirB N-terminal domain-containing protein, partial [Pseudomonadota bacterium]
AERTNSGMMMQSDADLLEKEPELSPRSLEQGTGNEPERESPAAASAPDAASDAASTQTADTVAILVAHGERGGARSNELLLNHAKSINSPDDPVFGAVLNGEPSLEAVLDQALAFSPQQILIYPFFIAPGYFVGRVLPRRIQESGLADTCRVLAPFGSDAGLPELITKRALGMAVREGWKPQDVRLLLVGHGSRSGAPASATATRAMAAKLKRMTNFAEVAVAYLEEPPLVASVLKKSSRSTIAVGFFCGDGLHSAEDVPEALSAWGGKSVYTGPVGAGPEVASLMGASIDLAKANRSASQPVREFGPNVFQRLRRIVSDTVEFWSFAKP